MKRKVCIGLLSFVLATSLIGCGDKTKKEQKTTETAEEQHATVSEVTLTEGEYGEEDLDATWEAAAAKQITLSDDITTITDAGTYVISGTATDGTIVVNVADGELVKLVLNNASITSKGKAPISVESGKVVITLAQGSENYVADADASEAEAAIYSKGNLTFNGSGTLEVKANKKNGILCEADLKLVSGAYTVSAKEIAIAGTDSVSIKGGSYSVTSGTDGIRAMNYEDPKKGYIMVDGGSFTIVSDEDSVQAETLLRINQGTFDITAANSVKEVGQTEMTPSPQGERPKMPEGEMPQRGERPEMPEGEVPQRGERPEMPEGEMPQRGERPEMPEGEMPQRGERPEMPEGEMPQESTEDETSRNALTSSVELVVADGTIDIKKCYEAVEANQLQILGGTINAVSSDDGINGSGDEGTALITISGGDITVSAEGDGIDSNGCIHMTGGKLTVYGPAGGGNGVIDFDDTFTMDGGTLIAVGSAEMPQTPSEKSKQQVLIWSENTALKANQQVVVLDSEGKEILSFETKKETTWIAVSNNKIEIDETYTLKCGEQSWEIK